MTAVRTYQRFLADYFPGLRLRAPLFYNWEKSLRFDLQTSSPDPEAYFQEVQRRAMALFEAAFAPQDILWLVLVERGYRRRKIRFRNFCFRQIAGLRRAEIRYATMRQRYEADRLEVWNVAAVEIVASRLNHRNLVQALAHTDFPLRQPQLTGGGVLSAAEIYLINADRQLIFHMYDDRGLDILATAAETLRPIYRQFDSWLLEYDRPAMETRLGNMRAQ